MSRLPHLGWSSHVYPLEAGDLAALPDCAGEPIPAAALPPDAVLLYIRPDGPDALLRGRAVVAAAAAADPRAAVPVRVVFKPAVAKWNLPGTLLRVFRNGRRFHGTGVYHTSAQAVRGLGLERAIRRIDAPQKRGRRDRMADMEQLQASLRAHGYDDARPLVVMLCRTGGVEDSLRQGHHRVSACLAYGVDRVALSFAAAGALPGELDGRRCAPGVRTALALLERLSPGAFVCVLAAALVHVDVCVLGQGCGGMGLVRGCQAGALLTAAALLLYRARCLAREQGGLALVAGGFLLAAVCGLDGLLAQLVASWAWMPPAALVAGAVLALAWRWRKSVPAGLAAICESRGVGHLVAGVTTALGFARLMGNAALWRAVVPGGDAALAVGRIVEEGCALLGCGLVLCWALPFALVGVTRRERRNPCHCLLPVLALLGAFALADWDYRRNCAEVRLPLDRTFVVERVGDVARPSHPADLSGLSPRGGGDLYWSVRDTDAELYSLRIPVDRASGRVLGCEVVGVHKLLGASDLEDVAADPLRAIVWVSDEKGPSIRAFSFDGRDVDARVDLPAVYLGVRKNRGLEALAINPNGRDMWTCNENELPADDPASPGRIEFVRLTRFTRRTLAQPWRVSGQWAYRLESPGAGGAGRARNGVAALCVLDDGEVLVLEREKAGKGEKATFRMRVCRVVFPGATDVSGWASLSERPFVPLGKQIAYEEETGRAMYEGMCLGPVLDDGSRTLLLISDGDGRASERVLSLRVRRDDERTTN